MDKKKKIIRGRLLLFCLLCALASTIYAQHPNIKFCDYFFDTIPGRDSITLFLSITDEKGNKINEINVSKLDNYSFFEDGNPIEFYRTSVVKAGSMRIPSDCTFSVLVDLSIPSEGKKGIFEAVKVLIENAPDSCVYLSFFGEKVTSSRLVNKQNIKDLEKEFEKVSSVKYFYGAVYSKLAEFCFGESNLIGYVHKEEGYEQNTGIFNRAYKTDTIPKKNYLLIFTEGDHQPQYEENIGYSDIVNFHRNPEAKPKPIIYAFYYTESAVLNDKVEPTLMGLTNNDKIPVQYRGGYYRSNDIDTVISSFKDIVNDAMYDYALKYKAMEGKSYQGAVQYTAKTGQNERGQGTFTIGTKEQPWPFKRDNPLFKYFLAIIITLLTILCFFLIIKVLIPAIRSKAFAVKYYKKYVPDEKVKIRNCNYCKRPILPGEPVVTRCKHLMHVDCWQQNGYKCTEYGQNCKEGIQEHVDWNNLFNYSSLRDFYLTMEGILAGFASWVIYDLFVKKPFTGLAKAISTTFIRNPEVLGQTALMTNCANKIASFLLIGLLLGFFMSIIFRYNDGARKNDWKSLLKLLGLSLLTSIIGMAAFLIGAVIFCWLLPSSGTVNISEWYYSFPAYLLFSVCTSLSLTIKSTIPVKSAMLGGICSAVIGFLVLYFSNFTSESYSWLNMFLNFAIFGGGLGASLVTVRILSEKYYLIIKNGVRAGLRIPIHKWMNATGGGNIVTIGMTERCEIQMTWEKSNKVAKEHVQLYVDHARSQAMLRPLATGVVYNSRTDLPSGKPIPLNNMDTFSVGDTVFQYTEN